MVHNRVHYIFMIRNIVHYIYDYHWANYAILYFIEFLNSIKRCSNDIINILYFKKLFFTNRIISPWLKTTYKIHSLTKGIYNGQKYRNFLMNRVTSKFYL